MTIADLKRIVADLPDATPVLGYSDEYMGFGSPNVCVQFVGGNESDGYHDSLGFVTRLDCGTLAFCIG